MHCAYFYYILTFRAYIYVRKSQEGKMSCSAIENSNFFGTKSVFANYECTGSLAFLAFTILNIVTAFFSNYVFSLRQQQRRMLLKVPRYFGANESERWRTEFYKFLYLTTGSQVVYIVQVVLIVNTSLWQLVIMIVASTFTDYLLYEFQFIKSDKYDTITDRDDIR